LWFLPGVRELLEVCERTVTVRATCNIRVGYYAPIALRMFVSLKQRVIG
jgi:hypothetical protein